MTAPKPTPDITLLVDELVLRLMTGRERLDRKEAERLVRELRAVHFNEAAEALDKIAGVIDACDDDRALEESEATRSCARALRITVGGIRRQVDAVSVLDEYDTIRRRAVLAEGADAIDQVADDAEAEAIERDGQAYGRSNKAVAIHREDAELLRRMAERSGT